MILNLFKIFAPLAVSFFIGLFITPILTHYLYKYRCWKKRAGKTDLNGQVTPIFNQLHEHKEVGTPRFGGVVIWLSVVLTVFGFWLAAQIWPGPVSAKLNFLSRNQVWLPLFTLVVGALIGLVD